mmetsp:Transcript_29454/g.53955  ORF Transcript_29454/g.53955 Transcript_29454/m.53955 type:complete len:1303 (-) Transcript_29454:233-4141(-)
MMIGGIMMQAFTAATDADKRAFTDACNNNEDLSETIFYMVPGDWMTSFLRFIESSNASENEKPDMIGNSALLLESLSLPVAPPHSPWGSPPASIYNAQDGSGGGLMAQTDDVDDEEHVRRRVLRRQKWQERQNQPHSLEINQTIKPGMVHHKDYALIGSYVWTLLSSKFGSDFAIPRQCIRLSQPDSGHLSNIAVEVYPRDALNRSADVSENDPCLKLVPTSGSLVHIPRSSDEDDSSVAGQGGDGMSDEDDLFPSIDNDDQETSVEAETPPVLLLPPSTTSSAGRKFALVSLESGGKDSAKDEMEYETEDSMVDANDEAASNKRKRYAAGLGNLGNTCFMNSSLQCLAHTDPLRQYFVSGSYLRDLNRGNPLGTGGELATEFANLLTQMWGIKSKEGKNIGRSPSSNGYNSYYSANSYDSSVVYPRNFKYALGKHAEQFIGYDQHDSQELATYLLDALHEDTNRVVKKPYVEKPEQGEDESDDVAAQKAWDVHLQRDNSHVLENFMGQVKSRVQCPTEGCGRVSTTFDPFMYLSVPIPGATERSITVTYVPMNGHERMKKVVVKLNKTSTVDVLQTKIAEVVNLGKTSDDLVAPENIAITDVWSHHEVFTFLKPDEETDKILDTDHTYAYQICPISTIHEQDEKKIESPDPIIETLEQEESGNQEVNNPVRLDLATITRLNRNEQWMSELEHFFVKPTSLFSLFKAKRCTDEERMSTYKKMESFIDRCSACREVSKEKWPNVQDGDSPEAHASVDAVKDDSGILSLEECSEMSSTFKGIRNVHDLAVFSFLSRKFYQHTMRLTNQRKDQFKDGIVVQIVFKSEIKTHGASYSVRHQHASAGSERTILTPFVLRTHQKLSVFELRELLSDRLSRLIKPHKETAAVGSMGSPRNEVGLPGTIANDLSIISNESDSKLISGKSESVTQDALTQPATLTNSNGSPVGSPESIIMRQVPLSFQRMNTYGYSKNNFATKILGSLTKEQGGMAMSTDDREQQAVSEVVGDHGKVILHWPSNLPDLDQSEWEMRDSSDVPDEEDDPDEEQLTVSACIKKYCQIEQLEETEMWYCSRCKNHVRAWKQFDLYKTPPILIIHMKRFQFSSTTHRRNKIDTFVDFPLTGLDLTEDAMKWTEHEKPIYDCYAVSNHYGGLGGGHYTAYARGDDGIWSHFDDSRVTTTISEDDVVSKAAYVLYYKRRDVEVGDIDELIEKASSHGPTIDDEFADTLSDTSEPTSLLYPEPPSELSLSKAAEGMVVGDETISNSSPTCSSPMDSMEGLCSGQDTDSFDSMSVRVSPDSNLGLLEPQ